MRKRTRLPASYRPSEAEEFMNPRQLEYFRQKLLSWRAELLADSTGTLQHLKEESLLKPDLTDRASLETERAIGNDWVVRHQNRLFQVTRQSRYAPARSKVVVCEWEDGRVEIRYGGRRLCHEEIALRPVVPASAAAKPRPQRRMPTPPQGSHPWRKSYQQLRPNRRTAQ